MRKTKAEILAGFSTEEFENSPILKTKRVGNNTYRINLKNGFIIFRLHNTNIIIFKENKMILNSGGWGTATTRDRINKYTIGNITQEKGIWYFQCGGNKYVFYDGMELDFNGNLLTEKKVVYEFHINMVKKAISKYVKLLDNMEKPPLPDNGDCFYCHFKDRNGNETTNIEHIKMHIKEEYIHGSIIYNALKFRGYKDPILIMQYGSKNDIKKALYKYLKFKLLPELAR